MVRTSINRRFGRLAQNTHGQHIGRPHWRSFLGQTWAMARLGFQRNKIYLLLSYVSKAYLIKTYWPVRLPFWFARCSRSRLSVFRLIGILLPLARWGSQGIAASLGAAVAAAHGHGHRLEVHRPPSSCH
jgi:hypothetical protein